MTIEHCKHWLGTLASPEFEGRATGQPGFQKAADFVAAHFKKLCLEARGDNGTYFQRVPWGNTTVNTEKTSVVFQKAGAWVHRIPAARLQGSATTAMTAEGDVVLLVVAAAEGSGQRPRGQRLESPALPGLDELDVKGKVVVAFVATTETTRAGVPAARFSLMQSLQGKEPAALLFAQTEEASGGLTGRSGGGRGAGNPALAGGRRSPLDATFGGKDLEALLTAGGLDSKALAPGDTAQLMPLPLQAKIEVAVDEGQAPAMNVWAVLPGSDPVKTDEYVVIGSHLDHLGKRGDTFFPGADDDGSGTTGVMAAAQMFAKNDKRPARSVLFVCFCGEESGLIGSRYFANNCPVPLASIAAELQMDMIGRDEEEGMDGRESLFSRSDHANFSRMGVPIAFFFTGLHRDYHKATDTPDKINFPKLLRVARYVYDIGYELASQPGRPEVDADLWAKYPGAGGKEPAAPMKKGS
ncbi:MAG: M28 family peptidase [Planctomycetota bacterium]